MVYQKIEESSIFLAYANRRSSHLIDWISSTPSIRWNLLTENDKILSKRGNIQQIVESSVILVQKKCHEIIFLSALPTSALDYSCFLNSSISSTVSFVVLLIISMEIPSFNISRATSFFPSFRPSSRPFSLPFSS